MLVIDYFLDFGVFSHLNVVLKQIWILFCDFKSCDEENNSNSELMVVRIRLVVVIVIAIEVIGVKVTVIVVVIYNINIYSMGQNFE